MNGMERQVLLSLAMIVKDGGTDLGRSLASASQLVDEMVVVDTGSRDASREVARSAGARVVDHIWRDDFAAARNVSIDACRGRWIFILDADEMLAPQDVSELRQWVTAQDRNDILLGAMMINRNYQPAGDLRDWQPVPVNDPHALPQGPPAPGFVPTRVVRIFPNRPEIRYAGCVHEMVDRSLLRAGGKMVELDVPVHHFGFLVPAPEKIRRYLKLARRKTQHDPQDHQAWSELADCCQNLNDREGCLAALGQAIKLRPDIPVYQLKAGLVHYAAGSFQEAATHLRAVVTLPQTTTLHLAEAHHSLGLIALRQGRLAEAGRHLQHALKLDPSEGRYWNGLGAWYLLGRQGEEARQALEKARALLPGHADPLLNLGILYEAAGQLDYARSFFTQALKCDPACQEARRRLDRLKDKITMG
jgi:Flp pilus assembly protein TadD